MMHRLVMTWESAVPGEREAELSIFTSYCSGEFRSPNCHLFFEFLADRSNSGGDNFQRVLQRRN